VSSIAEVRALVDAVPGVRFLIDTGHVVAWGGDLLELLPFAAHVQLRDARHGSAQVPPGDGDVDFAAVLGRLEGLGYEGALSVEYFDLPEHGWPCADPRADAVALRDFVTTLG
jgi:hydroxypyruvate isomerase